MVFLRSRFLCGLHQAVLAACVLLPLIANSQPVPADPAKALQPASSPVSPRPKESQPKPPLPGKPVWDDLTRSQQQALQPLAGTWTTISEAQKRKWLAVSKNYPALPADGQAKMHSRMNEWVNLSAQQRAEARLNFATTKELAKQLSAEEKLEKWQTYQALTSEEKLRLAEKASGRASGAALAVKPVAQQKLAPVQSQPSTSPSPTGSKLLQVLPKAEPTKSAVSGPAS